MIYRHEVPIQRLQLHATDGQRRLDLLWMIASAAKRRPRVRRFRRFLSWSRSTAHNTARNLVKVEATRRKGVWLVLQSRLDSSDQ